MKMYVKDGMLVITKKDASPESLSYNAKRAMIAVLKHVDPKMLDADDLYFYLEVMEGFTLDETQYEKALV